MFAVIYCSLLYYRIGQYHNFRISSLYFHSPCWTIAISILHGRFTHIASVEHWSTYAVAPSIAMFILMYVSDRVAHIYTSIEVLTFNHYAQDNFYGLDEFFGIV